MAHKAACREYGQDDLHGAFGMTENSSWVFIRVRTDLQAHGIPANEHALNGTKDLAEKNVENVSVSVFNKEYHGDLHMPNSLLR